MARWERQSEMQMMNKGGRVINVQGSIRDDLNEA